MGKGKKAAHGLRVVFSILLLLGAVGVLSYYYFGGDGASSAQIKEFSVKQIAGASGEPVVFDVGGVSKVAVVGLENQGLGGAAFLKVPLIDRWKLTRIAYQAPSSYKRLVLRVDIGTDQLFISSDGETVVQGKAIAWNGTYTRYVLWLAVIGFAWAAMMILGALVSRKTQ